MFKRLKVKTEPQKIGPDPNHVSVSELIGDANLPVTIKALNSLPENPKLRLYRTLIPIQVLAELDINPRTWKNPDKLQQVRLDAEQGSDKVKITAWYGNDPRNEFFYLGRWSGDVKHRLHRQRQSISPVKTRVIFDYKTGNYNQDNTDTASRSSP